MEMFIEERDIMDALLFWEIVDSLSLCDQYPKNFNPKIIEDPNNESNAMEE